MKKKHLKLSLIALALCLCLVSVIAFTWPEPSAPANMQTLDLTQTQNEFYIDEELYDTTMQNVVEPFIDNLKTTDYFTAEDGANLYYEQYLLENPSAHVTIAHGFTESSQKYKEVIYYFLKAGYSVSILDHRGHGLSERMIDDSSKVYIKSFDTYVSDLKTFMDAVVIPSTGDLPYLLYAHSMGGGIGALFIENHPDYFDAAVLSSPMMEVDTGSYPKPVAHLLTKAMVLFGQDETYIFGHGPYEDNFVLEENSPTSQARFLYIANKKANNTSLQVSGGTFSWLNAGINATRKLVKNAEKATTPVLLFQAENDDLVLPGGHYRFALKAPNTTLVLAPGSNHEIYFTHNDIMIPYFNRVLEFFKTYEKA